MGGSELLPQVTFAHRFSKRLENWPTVQQDLASKIVKIACTLDCRPAFGLKGDELAQLNLGHMYDMANGVD